MTTWCPVIGILVSSIAQLYAKSLLGLDGVLLSWSFPEFYVSTTGLEVSCSSFSVTYVSSTIWTHGSNSQGAETIIPLNNLLMLWEQSKSRSFQFPQYIGLHQLYQASNMCPLNTLMPFPGLCFLLSHRPQFQLFCIIVYFRWDTLACLSILPEWQLPNSLWAYFPSAEHSTVTSQCHLFIGSHWFDIIDKL